VNCQHCGAPMKLFRERGYFFCEHCGAFHFPPASSDGVRLLGEAHEGMACPVCRAPLLLATLDDRYHGYRCGTCRGMLFLRSSFRQAIQSRRARALEPADPPRQLPREELARRLACPRCAQPMHTHPYYGPGNTVIDTCEPCDLIWLDPGELEQIIHAPGRDRGLALQPTPEPSDDPEENRREKHRASHLETSLLAWLDRLF
jgi:Zn-finger nucleic acid-binding protein